MWVTRRFVPVVVVAIAVALLMARPGTSVAAVSDTPSGSTVPGGARVPSVSPEGGVHTKYFCGSDWKNVRPGGGTGYNIYNDDFGASTCLENTGNAGFTITRSTADGSYSAFPNTSSGWEWGVAPLHGYAYPVREKDDGEPRTSVSVGLVNSGVYNAAYDTWFSTYKQTNGQDNAAEVMIWLSCRDNCIGWEPVRIEGVEFLESQWVAYHNGVHWRYTAFVAATNRTYFTNLWLNPFFSAAGIDPNWYLTSIDFGFELYSGGDGLRVNSYSLTGVR